MMYFNDLDARTIRERVDMVQLWHAWIEADDLRRHSFLGTMQWESRGELQYLYRRRRGVTKSLGPRTARTEEIHDAFQSGRSANAERLKSLAGEMDRQAAILRSLQAGRLPVMAARTLRSLRQHQKDAGLRVIGTISLFAYEAMAGVRFNADSTSTADVDILVDDRNRLRLASEDGNVIGLSKLVQSTVDKTFAARGPSDFRLTNDRGYMIEFVRPQPDPIYRPMPGAEPLETGDVVPAQVFGLPWLVNAPVVETVVIDERGFPAPMRSPDPRYWAVYKLWLQGREDREPEKKLRDAEQAAVMFRLLREKLPQFPLDDAFMRSLPGDLRRQITVDEPRQDLRPDW